MSRRTFRLEPCGAASQQSCIAGAGPAAETHCSRAPGARTLVGALGAGHRTVDLAIGRRLPAGLYLVRLTQRDASRVSRVAVA